MKKMSIRSVIALQLVFVFIFLSVVSHVFAQALTSVEYVRKAWEASSQNNFEEVERLTNECVLHYSEEAQKQQAS